LRLAAQSSRVPGHELCLGVWAAWVAIALLLEAGNAGPGAAAEATPLVTVLARVQGVDLHLKDQSALGWRQHVSDLLMPVMCCCR